MRSQHRPIDRNIAPEQLRFLAAISPEYRDEFHRRELAAQSLRDQRVKDFVHAITTPDWSHRDSTPPSAQTRQFVDKITRSGSPGTDRPVTEEDVRRFVDAITGRGNAPLNEGGWDATKHPRVPKGDPNGGEFTTAGGIGGRRAASLLPHSAAKGASAEPAAWHPPVGHHWVPVSVVQHPSMRPFLSNEAVEFAAGAYSGPTNPPHGNIPANGIKHIEYSTSVKEEMEKYFRRNGISPNKKMTAAQMQEFAGLVEKGLGADGAAHRVIGPYNNGIKQSLKKGAARASSKLDEVLAAGRKYMKHPRFRLLAAGAVVSGILGVTLAAEVKVLDVAVKSHYYERAIRELQNGNLDRAQSLLTGEDQSLYAEIQGKVGVHAALNFKRAMEKVFVDAVRRDYN